jgi:hypothetical protein
VPRVYSIINEFWIPSLALVLFFFFQALGNLSELALTAGAVGVSALLFYWYDRMGEKYLYFFGVAIGAWIEVGFRYLGYQQVWADASFFGVPYWLPLAWGIMFVLITRFGVYIRGLTITD